MNRLLVWMPLGFFTILIGFFLKGLSLDPNSQPSALIGRPVPEFRLMELNTGRLLSIADLPNQPFLLNVWASWCVTCQIEHPFLTELSRSMPIVGLNYKDSVTDATNWLAKLGDNYAFHIFDPSGKMGLNLGVAGAPETFFVDASGIIRVRIQGEINQRIFDREIAPILRSSSQ